MARTHLVGLLLGTEEDWSGAFETLMARVAPSIAHGGERHEFATERVTIEPFDLRARPRYGLVIDRLAHWYYDESGQRLMHLQKAVDGFDVFARSLSIGAETMVMHFEPDRALHARYQEFCDRHLPHVDEVMAGYIASPEFDDVLVATVTQAFPPYEREQFVAHYRGLLAAWVGDQA